MRAVIAESFERIHRSNLVGMGILPLEFTAGASVASLGLTGEELFSIRGIAGRIAPRARVSVDAVARDGTRRTFEAIARIDNDVDAEYLRHGGILPMVLRELLQRLVPTQRSER